MTSPRKWICPQDWPTFEHLGWVKVKDAPDMSGHEYSLLVEWRRTSKPLMMEGKA